MLEVCFQFFSHDISPYLLTKLIKKRSGTTASDFDIKFKDEMIELISVERLDFDSYIEWDPRSD